MTKDLIIEKVKAFPPLDDTVSKVMAICNDENGSVAELAKVVEADPMTMANILKAANSPLYGFSREIKNITQAVSIFGMDTVKGFAFSSFLQKKLDLDLTAYGIKEDEFIHITEKQNALIHTWYKKSREMLEVLSLTSFLMEMGKIVLSNILSEQGKSEQFKGLALQCSTLKELESLEREVFGMSNEEVTAIIFQEWNFDEMMTESIKYLTDPASAPDEIAPYSQALQVAKTVISTIKGDQEFQIERAIELANSYELDTKALREAIELQFAVTA
jgi:HD-like signal output (HDOD) protein